MVLSRRGGLTVQDKDNDEAATKRRPQKDNENFIIHTPMEQFLYLLVEMENLAARQSICWTPAVPTDIY